MKYIKKFEESTVELPEVGDYVVIETHTFDEDYDKFINNTIFTVVECWLDDDHNHAVRLKCDYVPKKFSIYFFEGNEIIYWSSLIKVIAKTKEELELKISANKYNL